MGLEVDFHLFIYVNTLTVMLKFEFLQAYG